MVNSVSANHLSVVDFDVKSKTAASEWAKKQAATLRKYADEIEADPSILSVSAIVTFSDRTEMLDAINSDSRLVVLQTVGYLETLKQQIVQRTLDSMDTIE
ncbi:MAG: hypothetical protein OXU41_09595 [Gammaproteobacteria bacterium]|nr:hypothetical protein [Gammaproteobacteria bacterium]